MRAREIERSWYADAPPAFTLRVIAGIFRAATCLRRSLYRRGWLRRERLALPVIVIGNISVGGTGKTPLTLAVCADLKRRGWTPGVISRGYGGRARAPMLLTGAVDPELAGDEPALIHAHGFPVAIGRDRIAAAQLLPAEVDVIVADDGLQHLRLARDVEIVVIDGVRRFGNGWLLPAGPLRESPARIASVDFVVVNGGSAGDGEIPMQLTGDVAVALARPGQRVPLARFAGDTVHAVAGIGNPARFFASLRERGIDIIEHAFPDHHAYTAADLSFADGLPVLMTAKDAIKCAPFGREDWWQVPVAAQLPQGFFDALDARLRARPQSPARRPAAAAGARGANGER